MKKYLVFLKDMSGLRDTQQKAEDEAADAAYRGGRDYVVAEVVIVKVAHPIRNVKMEDPEVG